jgi:nucleotide-binding universal stress UspA family protein
MEPIKILIPTDFSVQADFAFSLVQNLSSTLPMEIHFLHILNVPESVVLKENQLIDSCGELDIKFMDNLRIIAARKLAMLEEAHPGVKTHLILGKTTQSIIDFAEKQKFDLIVMGTKGATGIREKLAGSETQHIARKSPIPVLSLMCDRSELKIKNILLVHNFEDTTKQDLGILQTLLSKFQPTLHFLQITKGKSEQELIRIETNMYDFSLANALPNFEAHIIQDKDVEQGVIHFNQMHEIDLVCMGTHGKGSIFHSSVTEKLINHLYKPMISFIIK